MTTNTPDTNARAMPEPCTQCQASLFDHVHGELSAQGMRVTTEHLAACADCALASCRLRAELDALVMSSGVEPSPGLHARLRASVQQAFGPPWYRRFAAVMRRPMPAYGLVLAAMVPLALGFVFGLGSPAHPGTTSSTSNASGERATSPARLDGYDASRTIGSQVVIF